MDFKKYLSDVHRVEVEKINLGIKGSDGQDVYISVLNSQKWGDFLDFISEYSALEGKTDPKSLKRSKELALEMICKLVVDDEGKNYLSLDMLNAMPAMMVAKIDSAVSAFILREQKNDKVEELKKN